jgi:UDP-N-acetylmuramoyl-tripeptide--D-alanyl-D-alanine ligase
MSAAFALIGFAVFAARRLLTYLHLFQQEEYDGGRFLRWLVETGAWDRRLSLALAVVFAAELALRQAFDPGPFVALAGVACLAVAAIERDPRKSAKKRLVMTARAKRIYALALLLAITAGFLVARSTDIVLVWVAPVQLVPLALVLANRLLGPVETWVQDRYWSEARAILQRVKPTVIAVTGSYGKTSVKHILGHVLESAAPTLFTPGSVNTPMGIARVVRERLQPHHRYFIVEMGAYAAGSIRRLCALTPPDLGIISAVGMAHYERFRTLDAVARAKFELAEAVRDNGGTIVLAADVLELAWPRDFVARHRDIVVTVGDDAGAGLIIHALRQEADGVVAEVEWHGARYTLRAPLYGLHQGRNLALAFAAACSLGLAPADVAAALATTPQIAHRLEVKRQANGTIIIDDAYNSNPVGFASALALLDALRPAGGRRILVTPGMAELGTAHDAEHARIGRLAAEYVDILLAVAPQRILAVTEAFGEAAPGREIVLCAAFAEAQAWLDRNLAAGDIVLIENDLPDLLEQKLRL